MQLNWKIKRNFNNDLTIDNVEITVYTQDTIDYIKDLYKASIRVPFIVNRDTYIKIYERLHNNKIHLIGLLE